MIGGILGEEQLPRADVQAALVKGLLCPALLELVCEALESSGRGPERFMACQILHAVQSCSSTCRRSMQIQ